MRTLKMTILGTGLLQMKFELFCVSYLYFLGHYNQHSQSQITMYRKVIFFSWGGKILHKVELLMIILLSVSFDSLITLSIGGLNMVLCSSMNDIFNNNLGTNCGSTWPSMDNFIQSFLLETPQHGDVVETNCDETFLSFYWLCMAALIWKTWPQHIASSDCILILFIDTKVVDRSLKFDF